MKELRKGFTTGSCAAAASKAAAFMLLSGLEKDEIEIITPSGISFKTNLYDITRNDSSISVSVLKDGGDDPDVTSGLFIVSEVSLSDEKGVTITGGTGIGRVTREGLDQPVGEYAINSVPREMIKKELVEISALFDYEGGFLVRLSVPGGEEAAEKTFNPRLGIIGGISIIGTSGIVEPMSKKALLDTIYLEMKQKRLSSDTLFLAPGNMGREAMKKEFGCDIDDFLKCSNFIGDAIDMAVSFSFKRLLFAGHIGKLIKVAGGIMNTHSREADSRLEILASIVLLAGGNEDIARRVLGCVNTEEALSIINDASPELLQKTGELISERIEHYLSKRGECALDVKCVVYSTSFGIIARSRGVKEYFQNG